MNYTILQDDTGKAQKQLTIGDMHIGDIAQITGDAGPYNLHWIVRVYSLNALEKYVVSLTNPGISWSFKDDITINIRLLKPGEKIVIEGKS